MGITGASGAIYAQRFLKQVVNQYEEIYLIMSEQAFQVAQTELEIEINRSNFSAQSFLGMDAPGLKLLNEKNFYTPPASGSFLHDGMVIVPASMGTCGRIAHGISNDLLTRAADVCLKEGRKLILVPREMPMNVIMLRNLTALAEAGATIIPAAPAWYHNPKTLEDLADTVVARIMQQLGLKQDLMKQWMSEEAST